MLLTLNAGSSSLKFALYGVEAGELAALAAGRVDGLGGRARFFVRAASGEEAQEPLEQEADCDHHDALGAIMAWLGRAHGDRLLVAVGHRVVHGGAEHMRPAVIDAALLADLRRLEPLAPLHQPHNLDGVEAAMRAFPGAVQVACFDTAFHRTHPFVADTFALPRRYYDEGVRRYGFHGLSYEFIARRLRAVAPVQAVGRVIIAHLGNGASLCALRDGKSVASTMGFTALDGMPMGTRCGQLDPGVVLYLMAEKGMSAQAITDLLYNESGLKGMSGLSHDMRVLEASGSDGARDAIAYFVARLRREIGGLAATIGGLDAIVFTGGIGENAVIIREAALSNLAWMGVALDAAANARGAQVISAQDSPVTVFVLATDEERMIAEHTAELLELIGAAKRGKPNAQAEGAAA